MCFAIISFRRSACAADMGQIVLAFDPVCFAAP
jgi:hypothetical protein